MQAEADEIELERLSLDEHADTDDDKSRDLDLEETETATLLNRGVASIIGHSNGAGGFLQAVPSLRKSNSISGQSGSLSVTASPRSSSPCDLERGTGSANSARASPSHRNGRPEEPALRPFQPSLSRHPVLSTTSSVSSHRLADRVGDGIRTDLA